MNRGSDDYLSVGTIIGVHGLGGNLRVQSSADNLSDFSPGGRVFVRYDNGHQTGFTIKTCQPHRGQFLLALAEITDRTAAEALKGLSLLRLRSELPALESDTYFWEDILGLTVIDRAHDQPLGEITDIIPTGGNDVYVIVDGQTGREIMLPAIKSVVCRVDLRAGCMYVNKPEEI